MSINFINEFLCYLNFASSNNLQFNKEMLTWDCRKFLDQLSCSNLKSLSSNIVICTFWKLLEAFTTAMPTEGLSVSNVFFPVLDFLLFLPLPARTSAVNANWYVDLKRHLLVRGNVLLSILQGGHEKWASKLQDLFVIFSSSHFNEVFKEHRHYLVTKSKISPVHFLCSIFTVQGDYYVIIFKMSVLMISFHNFSSILVFYFLSFG